MTETASVQAVDPELLGTAIRILDGHRIMAVSTVRKDGWPQTTIVGYANLGLLIYFLVFRKSQKLGNIEHDQRISIAVAEEPRDASKIQAVYAGAIASEILDPAEREHAWRLLGERHPNLAGLDLPSPADAAFLKATCKYVSVLDYLQSPGRAHNFAV